VRYCRKAFNDSGTSSGISPSNAGNVHLMNAQPAHCASHHQQGALTEELAPSEAFPAVHMAETQSLAGIQAVYALQ
jgi:hypothetical protein